MPSPRSLHIEANELVHHVLAWEPAGEGTRRGEPSTVLLLHGFMDAAGTWDLVAPALAAAGHRVLALDLRGFGDGARAPRGAYYHFADYVFDVADVVDRVVPEGPLAVVGHSMGGTVATLYAGAHPERVARLVNVEGLGPPDMPPELAPIRMRAWIDGVRRVRGKRGARGEGGSFSRAEALMRLGANHPGLPPELLASRLVHLAAARPEAGEAGDDLVAWRSDPLHRTTSPVPFFASVFIAFARRVTCPVLFVSGGPKGFHPEDETERLAAFADLRRADIDDAGHMVHWTRPDALAELLKGFLG